MPDSRPVGQSETSEGAIRDMQTAWPKTVDGRYQRAETMVLEAAEIVESLNKFGTAQALRMLAGEIASKRRTDA